VVGLEQAIDERLQLGPVQLAEGEVAAAGR
jgi:hypothetical protein